jgi:hypothetical protein
MQRANSALTAGAAIVEGDDDSTSGLVTAAKSTA